MKKLLVHNEIDESLKQYFKDSTQNTSDYEVILSNILEGTMAGFWDWHIKDNYEYMSPTFKKMFGYEDHEIENHPDSWQKIIHPEDLPGVFDVFNKHVASKGKFPYDNEVRYYHKDGSIVWVFCRGKVIEWDEEGNPLRMIGSHIDITKIKEAEQTKKINIALEQKNQELERFAYVASHDLQEPLQSLQIFTDLLKEEFALELGKQGVQYIEYIDASRKKMSGLIKSLLDYSLIGSEDKKTITNVQVIVDQLTFENKELIEETNTKISYDNLPVLIAFDLQLKLVFHNLILNSIFFRSKNRSPKINIDAVKKDNYWTFKITDNGGGIGKDHIDRIFLLFQKLRHENSGAGIGLAFCKKIVELHQGKIWLESEVGIGTSVFFTIKV
ncbi:PAS domain-containing protein [Flammeovirga yaeyamensis]|uniref:histidine kinase n=1 Tax=Flammeovirga yaeyamensis TaxID=367791 RepID=A0AAX1N5X2_9BACT|nr:PAS domain-containing sensor histidine kinase [Flammeovirga yaeyamensis]MBB3697556.1 PAS domain S-box-containing protein [Flammeovirga yaeyamensis]NMF36250.1 PAS domain-containing protein [Flammeovirga yaeyamensis]QWG02979.1 PAS domain-containing protein [Flammeovirga yaeyamensis]